MVFPDINKVRQNVQSFFLGREQFLIQELAPKISEEIEKASLLGKASCILTINQFFVEYPDSLSKVTSELKKSGYVVVVDNQTLTISW